MRSSRSSINWSRSAKRLAVAAVSVASLTLFAPFASGAKADAAGPFGSYSGQIRITLACAGGLQPVTTMNAGDSIDGTLEMTVTASQGTAAIMFFGSEEWSTHQGTDGSPVPFSFTAKVDNSPVLACVGNPGDVAQVDFTVHRASITRRYQPVTSGLEMAQ